MIEGSLQVKLPTIWTDEKQRWEESEKRREEKKKEDHKRESLRRKKIQVRKKAGKSRNIVFFQWFVAPEGRKVGSLKRRVRSHVVRWEMKSCTPLWREAHFQVKMCKTHQHRSTFKSCDVEKVHAVVAQSTFRSQKCKKLTGSEYFWKLRCRKSACGCFTPTFRSQKCKKNWRVQSTFGSWDVEKVHAVVARSTFRSQAWKNLKGYGALLDVQMPFCVAGDGDCASCQKWANREGFVAVSKTMAGVGHMQRICKNAFSVAGTAHETCSSELLGGPGADFLRGIAFWSIRSSGLLRWLCATGAALRMTWHHFFVPGAVL